jgi:type II secretory pathway pseudopilin PulG
MKLRLPLHRLGRASGRFARVAAREDGFSLIEAVAAILIVMIFMAASAASLISGYRAIRQTKYFQQGTALGNRAIEAARDVTYDSLAMLNSDLAGDADIMSSCPPLLPSPGNFYDPGGAALDCERIVSAAGNVDITNHIQTVTVEGKVFTIKRYVTWVDNDNQGDIGQDYKRLSVVVEWDDNGTTDSFETSTFVSRARRGLPVPKFELAPAAQTKQVEQGQSVTFAHTIENLGIVDTYDIEMPVPAGWGVQFYADDEVDGERGVYDPLFDEALTDTNGSGTPDTGSVATDGVTYFLAVVTVPLTQPNGGVNVPLTATSGVDEEVTAESANRAGVGPVGIALYLHHNPSPPVGTTTAQNQIPMNITAPTATTLYKYSTNYYNPTAPVYPGRYLENVATTPAVNENTASRMVNWVYQVPASTLFEGNGSIRLWVAARDQRCDRSISLRFYIRRKNAANSNSAGQTTLLSQLDATVPASGGVAPCAFRQVDVPFTLSPGTTIPTNNWIELKVVVNSASADHALLAYDTTTYPSRLLMPQVTL